MKRSSVDRYFLSIFCGIIAVPVAAHFFGNVAAIVAALAAVVYTYHILFSTFFMMLKEKNTDNESAD
jgi:hypothetical protein